MPEWKDWTPYGVEEGVQAFARLSKLSITRCPKLLHELPKNLLSLRKLDIEECPMLVFAWVLSSTERNEVRNTLHFDSLVSLHLNNVLISDSCSFEVCGQAVLRNSRYSLLSSLTSLKVESIRGHTCLPIWFLGLTGLVELYLSGFEELTTLWENELRLQGCLPVLRRLAIRNCPKLVSLFAEGGKGDDLKSLQKLSIYRCPCLFSFPTTGLPSTLRELQIEFCDGLLSPLDLTLLNNLEKLYISSCPSLTYLSAGRGLPLALKELMVHRCAKLKSLIAEGMKNISPSLEYIEICDCKSLKTLPDVMQNNCLKNLCRLQIWNCENLESLPEGWFPTTNLTEFYIFDCEKIELLTNHTYNNNNHLASLKTLGLNSSPMATGLVSLILNEGSSFCFTNITSLDIANVDIGKLCGLHRLYSLRGLSLSDCDWVSFPEDGKLSFPSSLVVLRIWKFPYLEKLSFKDFENLVSLGQLQIDNCPKLTSISELGQLPSLSDLEICYCPNLASFPEHGLPPSLLPLVIHGCPILEQRCEKGKGKYWRFIAHIPEVWIDHRFVFDPSS